MKRTSMSDLCEVASVSRQTLYNHFRNKDDILRGLIKRYTDLALAEIHADLQAANSLGARLDLIFDRMVVRGYDTIQTMPNAQDFIDGVNAVSEEALQQSAERFRAVIFDTLVPHAQVFSKRGLDVAELSDFVQRAAKTAGMTARDRADLIQQLVTLRQLCTTAASQPEADPTENKEG